MNILDKIPLFLSDIPYHCRKVLLKHSEKKIKLRVYADYDAQIIDGSVFFTSRSLTLFCYLLSVTINKVQESIILRF